MNFISSEKGRSMPDSILGVLKDSDREEKEQEERDKIRAEREERKQKNMEWRSK